MPETDLGGSLEAQIGTLISSLAKTDPRLYQALDLMNSRLELIRLELNPLIEDTVDTTDPTVFDGVPPSTFNATSTGTTIRFTWSAVAEAVQYEIRRGTVWETASLQLRTINLTADIDPLVYGSYTFLIKAIDGFGNYTELASQVIFDVNQIPGPSVTVRVIDNNVLLFWSEPTSTFNIRKYNLYKNDVLVGFSFSTFAAFFEVVSGTYSYSIEAVDIVGNVGSKTNVSALVNQPPDYILQERTVSTLDGTKVNTIKYNDRLLCCVNTCS